MARKTPAKKTGHLPEVAFHIDTMDPLGQGVFKSDGHIGFIAKTLPGETGTAQLQQIKKGVRFAKLKTLEQAAKERIEAACPHYETCPGCHYLHTGYEQEIAFKKAALQRLLHRLSLDNDAIKVIPAPQRQHYRNRIQLHYRGDKLGLIDVSNDSIVEIPQCQLIRDELRPSLQQLYNDRTWSRSHKNEGHCEIYLKDGSVSTEWNQAYSHGGFTQVFEAMNQHLRDIVTSAMQEAGGQAILDLFAGDGNLSNDYVAQQAQTGQTLQRVMVDAVPCTHEDFIKLDLFAEDALKQFQKRNNDQPFDTLLLDPPRKGFPAIDAWIKACNPKHLIYVSCNPATLARDLQKLEKCHIDKVLLLDLFPGTYHFETVIVAHFGKRRKM